jgi:hypothetical protein
MQVLISDANILIDLEEGLLLETLFRLPYQFKVPDILFEEELKAYHGNLIDLGLLIGGLTGVFMVKATSLINTYSKPSRNDCFALALAIQDCCTLLTGDANLRSAAAQEQVNVKGTLWVVEEMVKHSLISKQSAHEAYDRMQRHARRLPWADAHRRIEELN